MRASVSRWTAQGATSRGAGSAFRRSVAGLDLHRRQCGCLVAKVNAADVIGLRLFPRREQWDSGNGIAVDSGERLHHRGYNSTDFLATG